MDFACKGTKNNSDKHSLSAKKTQKRNRSVSAAVYFLFIVEKL
jgi:hypothetical protein